MDETADSGASEAMQAEKRGSRAGTRNHAIHFYPDRWRRYAEGLSRLERILCFEVAVENWKRRSPALVAEFEMAGDGPMVADLVRRGFLTRLPAGLVCSVVRKMALGTKVHRPVPSLWKETRARIFDRDGYRCRYCGVRTTSPDCDHIYPVLLGGEHDDNNLATACVSCNRRKGSRTLEQLGWKI